MKPYFGKVMAVFGLAFAFSLLVPSVAQAAECGTPAKEAVYKVVVTPAVPAVTEEVKVIDQAYVPAVPEVPEVPAVPEIPEVFHMVSVTLHAAYDEVVVDKEAYDEVVPNGWQRYSWTGGPHAEDDAPGWPSDDWQPNVEGDPHGVGVAGAYWRSNGNSGNGDWFYLEGLTKVVHHEAETHIVHHEAVVEEQKVIDQEYVPGKPAVPAIPGVPAVEEVSHMETVVLEPAIPETRETVLVSKAVPAGPKCEKPEEPEEPLVPASYEDPNPPAMLAQTGTDAKFPALLGLAILGTGVLFLGMSRLKTTP